MREGAEIRNTKEPDGKSLEAYRNMYRGTRALFTDYDHTTFDAYVIAKMWEEATPFDWMLAAKTATPSCPRCAGTGKYITRVENNKPTGPGGECYRCQGKGFQNLEDAKRNLYYDVHGRLGT